MKNSPETLAKRNALRARWKKEIDPETVPKTIIRVCKDCGEVKECGWNYVFSAHGKPVYRARCIDCHRVYEASIQKRHQKHISARSKERKRENKQKAINYLGGACALCGYNKSMFALTFHHEGAIEKDRDISRMADWSWEKIQAELDKCVLLCFNCHMEIHWCKDKIDQ